MQTLHPTLARAMLAMAPPSSVVHQIVEQDQAQRIDAAVHADKLDDGYGRRKALAALNLQIQSNPQYWGNA